MVVRRFTYQVTVPADTAVRLGRVFGACRFVYNAYLDLARAAREAGGKHPSWIDGQRELRASFVVEAPKPQPTTPTRAPRAAGMDVGLTDYAAIVYSDGTREKVPNPRFLRNAERKLARAQKHLSRTQKGSRNRENARREVARLHARVRHLRENHARQLASRLTRENQAVAVETLNITGLGRTRLAKSIHDAGWGQFIIFLEVNRPGFRSVLYFRMDDDAKEV